MYRYTAVLACLALAPTAFAQNTQQTDASQSPASTAASSPAPDSYWAPDLAMGAVLSTDGMFRGLSGTRSRPGTFGYLTALSGPFYIGATLMNKNPGQDLGISAESDWMVGVKPVVGPLRFDFNVYRDHLMPNDSADYWEFKAGVGTDLPYGIVGNLNYYHSPNYAQSGATENVYELQLNKAFNDKWMVSGEIGSVSYSANPVFKTYAYWDVGVSYNITDTLSADLRYYDSNLSSRDCSPAGTCHGRVVLSLMWNTTLRQLLKHG
ncbi:TorF family putative porin [Burkholderia multivorans]|nr:TorF family putative porin [Burkholderia multivorans]